ncbi:hypothetical protein GB931_00785 [Modestobacter sp. I12A-02628]|uniref:Uncharacterized protein n=1 Tax=Goekera deserti TaxID=2497753 RepID=A0A7K3WG88_9ACTN|nr:hypothetical protein [Goekera deserti]MPQ96477.1 hypothetical protein [Goekera deserti]NDI47208.1 hypothetical protein [Goekera deserti]NEL55392.1 hypothetical protein [Goekera deserti]
MTSLRSRKAPERWLLTCDGREHRVEITEVRLRRRVGWLVDGTEVAATTTSDEHVVLNGGEHGAVGVRLPRFTGPARRITWWSPDTRPGAVAAAHTGLGGTDLDPEPGSKAAAREAWIRAHPNLHAARHAGGAVLGVVLPLVVLWLLAQVSLPAIPWPDWDLPSIPWPDWDLPTIPLPDWDLPELPAWVRELLDKATYVAPVLVAFVVARAEVRRRRAQDQRKQSAERGA